MFPKGRQTMTAAPKRSHTLTAARAGVASIALVFGLSGSAMAQDIGFALQTFKLVEIVNDAGETRIERTEAETVLPGDRVLYRIEMTNPAEDAATDLSLDLAINEALIIAPETFVADITYQVTFATLNAPEEFMPFPELVVPTEDGGTRPAAPEDLGALRVLIAELPALENAFVEYEAFVR